MSLRVWLPLNGTLDNQGLDDAVMMNNGATIDDNGKIGKCYSFDGSNDFIYNNNINLARNEMSVCCWIYLISYKSSGIVFRLGYKKAQEDQLGIYINNSNHMIIPSANGTQFTNTNCTMPLNEWHHICFTIKGTSSKLYLDGNLTFTGVNANKNILSSQFCIGARANSSLGANTNFSYPMNGKINDFRLYDHALSPFEVKQISQGLILHYPLNNNGFGQKNLLINSNIERTSKNTYIYWPFTEDDISKISGNVCTISFDAKSTVDNVACDVYFRKNSIVGESIIVPNITTKYKRYSVTMTAPTSTFVSFCIRNNGNVSGVSTTATYSYKNIKVELGQKATPWCPHEADELYNQLKINNNIQYDTSGYKNNGVKTGTFTYDSDTPKYNVSMVFNKASYINIGQQLFNARDEITVNLWVKASSWATNPGTFFSSMESGGNGWQKKSDNNYTVSCGTGASSNSYASTSITTTSLDASKWHMMTFTYDGMVLKTYIDAILQTTVSKYSTKTPLFYNSKSTMFIGGEATGNKNTPANNSSYPNFKGNISDVRIYCTALSAEDILSLYNNSAYIDNQGNIYGAIYEEV